MDKRDILRGVYNDFFRGDLSINENDSKEIEKEINDTEFPKIELPEKNTENKVLNKEEVSDNIQKTFENIDELLIDDKSKAMLKSIIEYIRRYNQGIEKSFISFNLCIQTKNKETLQEILHILNDNINYYSYLPNGDIALISFYDIETAKNIEEIYSSDNNIIVFEDCKAFDMKDQNEKEKIIYKLNQCISENRNKYLTIFAIQNKEEIQNIFYMSNEIKDEFDDYEIVEINPDIPQVYAEVEDKIQDAIEYNDDMKVKLLDYITVTYPKTELSYPKYRDDLINKIIFTKQIPEYEKDKSMDEIFEELNKLVGLEKVKKMLKELVSLVELKSKAKDDLKIKDINLHMVFLGNPGTGKTTVARIVAEILYNLKYIKQNKLIEVSSKDLVAEYVGQTAPKTMAVIQKALGGVLFVDEAYSLASNKGQGSSYNEEAIATLIQAMENYRDNLVVIFAGYTKEMQDFLDMNSGIVSRIGYTVEFEDYTEDELLKIFMGMMEKAGFEVSQEAQNKVKEIISEYKDTKNFGNARFVRNVYEKSIVKHAANTANKKQKKILKTITEKDISTDNLLKM